MELIQTHRQICEPKARSVWDIFLDGLRRFMN
jgi:hypothetical protein